MVIVLRLLKHKLIENLILNLSLSYVIFTVGLGLVHIHT